MGMGMMICRGGFSRKESENGLERWVVGWDGARLYVLYEKAFALLT